MILRKPYAFLIKYFRIIHFVLFLFMLYLIYSTNNILGFFKDYIEVGSAILKANTASTFVNPFMYLSSILVVGISIIIYILMKQKDKPRRFYLFIIVTYSAFITYMVYVSGILRTVELYGASPQAIRFYRDTALVVTIFELIFVLYIFVRAVGFDIRKFNFGEDIAKLEISEEDREEFELSIDVSNQRIWRILRRQKREWKYFYLENKFLMQLILFFILGVIGIYTYINVTVVNKIYDQTDTIRYGDYQIKVNSVYTTARDKNGNVLVNTKKYVILDLNVTNVGAKPINEDKLDMDLVSVNRYYYRKTNINSFFIDLGELAESKNIAVGESKNLIYIFESDSRDINTNYILRFIKGYIMKGSNMIPQYMKMRIKVWNFDVAMSSKTTVLKEVGTIEDFGQTTLSISGYETIKKIKYIGKTCANKVCYDVERLIIATPTDQEYTTLLKITPTFTFDTKITYLNYDFISFLNHYGSIRFKYNGQYLENKILDVTPSDYPSKDYFLIVSAKVEKASEIQLVLNMRNHKYIYQLKG